MSSLLVHVPKTLTELQQMLKDFTDRTRILAGGTDLTIALNKKTINPDQLVVLSCINELMGIQEHEDMVQIGAATTFSEIEASKIIRNYYPALAEAAADLGSVQIRNTATIGGNIANASPAGDSLPVLMALDGRVSMMDKSGYIKEFSIDEFLVGAGKTLLKPGQVIVNIKIPIPSPAFRSAFVKLGSRSKVTIALVNLAGALSLDDKAGIKTARIVLGAVYEKPLRVPEAEYLLENGKYDEDLLHKVVEILSHLIEEKHRAASLTWEYKKRAVRGVVYDLMNKLLPNNF